MKEIKNSFLFISCEEAYKICDKSQYGEASLWEKIKLNMRFIWCHVTQAYVKKNLRLTKVMKAANVQSLNKNERDMLMDRFNQELKNKMQQ